jgi:putative acyl-CoA dehydrogenase
VRSAPACVADAFCAARLQQEAGLLFGALPAGVPRREILARALSSEGWQGSVPET